MNGKISAHHGHVDYPNNLSHAVAVIEEYREIDIVEIDFVSFGDDIVSSHDYDIDIISFGSVLQDWIESIVVEHRKILWIDIKENLFIYLNWMYNTFNVPLLLRKLQLIRRIIYKDRGCDITPYVWIGCQDGDLLNHIIRENDTMKHPWKIMLDMPTVSSYIYQHISPPCFSRLLEDMVIDEFKNKPVRQYDIIAIDQSFFNTMTSLIQFIKSLNLRPETNVILYTFKERVDAPRIKNINIIMQYDYHLQ